MALALLAASFSRALGADSVRLSWDAGPEPDLAGYRVYFRTADALYGPGIDVGPTTTAQVSNLIVGTTYYFAVTAYNSVGLESPFSAEIAFTATPNATTTTISSMQRLADGSFQFLLTSPPSALQALNIYVSSDLKTWTLLSSVTNSTGKLLFSDPGAVGADRRFYRVSNN